MAGVVLELPAKDRTGKTAWLGPIALGLAVLSWLLPAGGEIVAAVAVACGAVSILTRRSYRIDWTAVAGLSLAVANLFLALVLWAMALSDL